MTAEQLITFIIKLYTYYLEELNSQPKNDFIHGEMTAYVETLEIIQACNKDLAKELNYVIEEKYKI
ncbi:MAG: hypothetical protein IKB67_03475 [Clostridia bacterium]|nr:hypothetical protein [Clostridia bacterium]